ncbi:hypothetical protein [Clavibacter phaseoli]|uniref:hypothetical protein n=1 Tax=Clavibacter phaseoli TaxID=1734031 RepID=UPI001F26404C|nr:hypothetical protein [Clavibacter phaseoli]UKF32460.1 hypothetical protein FGD69_15090 [Clavibacter phaseoli]UKF38519.1 hypothetical protein FGI33_15260 [Clavibacter phaseoli]
MDLRIVLVILTVLGFILTTGGLLGAAIQARRVLKLEAVRIDCFHALGEAEKAEREGAQDETDAEYDETIEKWEAAYRVHGLLRPSYDNMNAAPLFEAERVVRLVLGSTTMGTLVALSGLLVGTTASVWSLWI